MGEVDLDAYFRRIRWSGDTRPSYETLAGILDAHMRRIPFENIDVLLGRGVRLDLAGLQDKLVRQQRGGYCFEHGTLFAAVLEQLGFALVRHTARVVLFAPRTQSPRAHMFLTVALAEGTFVVDPGFGALAPRVPVCLDDGVVATAGGESHRMARLGSEWMLQSVTAGALTDCWVSAVEHDNLIDFEVGNHFTATYPNSPFVNRLMLRALTDRGRIGVMNRDVTEWRDGERNTYQLEDRKALRELLAERFGFDLPEVERLRVPVVGEWQ
jgi:N-hydroxyarylamine O-acetyltransferase